MEFAALKSRLGSSNLPTPKAGPGVKRQDVEDAELNDLEEKLTTWLRNEIKRDQAKDTTKRNKYLVKFLTGQKVSYWFGFWAKYRQGNVYARKAVEVELFRHAIVTTRWFIRSSVLLRLGSRFE